MNTAAEKQKELAREQLIQQIQLGIGAVLLFFTAFFLTVLFGGELTKPLRDSLGITAFLSEQAGVYADCSVHSNQNNRFCKKDYASALKKPARKSDFWRKPGDGPVFSLNE